MTCEPGSAENAKTARSSRGASQTFEESQSIGQSALLDHLKQKTGQQKISAVRAEYITDVLGRREGDGRGARLNTPAEVLAFLGTDHNFWKSLSHIENGRMSIVFTR